MAKSGRLPILVSLLACFVFSSCAIPPTYSRQNIGQVIRRICAEDYKLDVRVWEKGETIWVYAPFDHLLNDQGDWSDEAKKAENDIFMSLSRIIFSMDKPPKFFVMVLADIKKVGADVFFIGYIPDIVKRQMNFISDGEFSERLSMQAFKNPKAIGDADGKHLPVTDITLGDFIGYLVRQELQKKIGDPGLKENFTINRIESNYSKNVLRILVDVKVEKEKPGLIEPFQEVKKSLKKFLKIYASSEVTQVQIIDTSSGKDQTISVRALMDEKS